MCLCTLLCFTEAEVLVSYYIISGVSLFSSTTVHIPQAGGTAHIVYEVLGVTEDFPITVNISTVDGFAKGTICLCMK